MIYQLMQTAAGSGGGLTIETAAIIGVGTAIAAVVTAFKRGQSNPKVKAAATLQEPVPDLPVRKVYSPPTFWQHKALEDRVAKLESNFEMLRREQHEGFLSLMTAGENRKDMIFEKIDTMARAFHARVDDIVSTNPSRKPRP